MPEPEAHPGCRRSLRRRAPGHAFRWIPAWAGVAPWLPLMLLLARPLATRAAADGARPLDFQREVRPILANHCFACHGPDAGRRKGGLRLDTAEGATADLGGHAAVVPGQPAQSTLLARIREADPAERMPPPESKRDLSDTDRAVLERWVREGGAYARHWAFMPPARAPLPATRAAHWARQPMDRFILARLEGEGLEPSPEAWPGTWLRRASFDLTGLAPGPGEVDAFLAAVEARGEAAYAEAVDRLLASPGYGERQAQEWLDVARFADTHGFNNDTTRTQWRWRDWVIEAFNDGMPYDRFLTEQLAGDLLPNPTLAQRIATGFSRNHVVNSEGGIIDEEYRVEYVADRVRTLGMAWLGLTLECSRCHDHKYDPLSQADYYRLFAFFNNVAEVGEDGRIGNAAPILSAPTRPQQEAIEALTAAIDRESAVLARAAMPGPASGAMVGAFRAAAAAASPLAPAPPDPAFALSVATRPAGFPDPWMDAVIEPAGRTNLVLAVPPATFSAAQPWTLAAWVRWEGGEAPILSTMDMAVDPSAGGHGRGAEVRVTAAGEVEVRLAEFWPAYAIQLRSAERIRPGIWRHVAASYDGHPKASGVRIYLDGRPADVLLVRDGLTGRSGAGKGPVLGATAARNPETFRGALGGLRLYPSALEPAALARWVEDRAARRWLEAEDRGGLAEAAAAANQPVPEWVLRARDPALAARWEERERLRSERQARWREAPQAMVMSELPEPRPTHVLQRGQYATRGERVTPAVPGSLGIPWPAHEPRNRLGLARWLTDPGHPLTARVVVNRFWAQLFGAGLVRTVEDFGVQGELPTHPELLDWLARDLVETGWDTKRLLRGWVLSATYRQDSAVTPALRERDPANRLLARGPRVRLPAEAIRDHALQLGGLLRHRLGGPSVFPPQPETLYQGVVVAADYPGTRWTVSLGEDRYRRSLYTFWKRTVPHPVMTTFDAPDREFCSARRLPTNTPLQALALMNEPTFVEAGTALGLRAFREAGPADADRLAHLFRLATGRTPEAAEAASLLRTLERIRALAGAASGSGEARGGEPAVWGALGGLVLNLDETITKH